MALIAPFRGLRYNSTRVPKLEEVVTPPYDVIDRKAQEDLLKKNPYNMIQLDLSKNIDPAGMTDERYRHSRDLLEQWQAEGILVRDSEPAVYLYFIEYQHPSGRRLTRKGLVCLTGLAEFSEGIVKPHEQIFRGVVTDRLRLLDTCRTQFSQVFALYPDQEGAVMSSLEAGRSGTPLCEAFDHDGCRHSLWSITDPAVILHVAGLFAAKSVYIADGHHRYNTALQMRELIVEREGSVTPDSPFNHIMMYLCAMEDPGLSVLPTHRLVQMPGVGADDLVKRLAEGFVVEEIRGGTREVLLAEVLARMDEIVEGNCFGLYHPVEDRCYLLIMKPGMMEAAGLDTIPASLRELDVVVLSELILEKYLQLSHQECEERNLIDYFSDPDEALDQAVKNSIGSEEVSILFLMKNTLVAQVKRVSDEELIMPHKSTYFYPKVLTGLVLNKMESDEVVGS
ncbi:MAG: DUF1015 domain-containing protein [Proteobacteria bacterium]|nr:DUF1015 domain-containing protein [Pseudomonadota bacterium]MBU1688341.1 DUF1015 domain-containing protein [Pseudomonadota bacterium]